MLACVRSVHMLLIRFCFLGIHLLLFLKLCKKIRSKGDRNRLDLHI